VGGDRSEMEKRIPLLHPRGSVRGAETADTLVVEGLLYTHLPMSTKAVK
jgi:hypothetical protein